MFSQAGTKELLINPLTANELRDLITAYENGEVEVRLEGREWRTGEVLTAVWRGREFLVTIG